MKRVYQPALMVPGRNGVLDEPIIVLPVSSASCMKIYEYNLWYINTIMFILFKVFLWVMYIAYVWFICRACISVWRKVKENHKFLCKREKNAGYVLLPNPMVILPVYISAVKIGPVEQRQWSRPWHMRCSRRKRPQGER